MERKFRRSNVPIKYPDSRDKQQHISQNDDYRSVRQRADRDWNVQFHKWNKRQHNSQDGIETTIHLKSDVQNRGTSSSCILYHSDHCVEASVGQNLKSLINGMDTNEFIVQNVSDGIKRTDIISQYQHFPNYLQSMPDNNTDKRVISLAPTIYSIKEQKFLTEINGLPHAENKQLYALIERIFNKFMPMFECLFKKSNYSLYDSPFDQLPVIVKIQKYDVTKVCSFVGHWHSEGALEDDIMAVGLYYFDISECGAYDFDDHFLEIAHKKTMNETVKMEIKENDCMVFKNSDMRQIVKHRASFSTERWGRGVCHASRSVLSFFVQKKRRGCSTVPGYKWYNYPWKTDIFVHHFIKRDVCQEVIDLIAVFAFGTTEHRKFQISSYVKKYVLSDEKSNKKEPFPSISRRGRCRRAN